MKIAILSAVVLCLLLPVVTAGLGKNVPMKTFHKGRKYRLWVLYVWEPQAIKNMKAFQNLGWTQAKHRVYQMVHYIGQEINKYFGELRQYGIDIQLRATYRVYADHGVHPQNDGKLVDALGDFEKWLKKYKNQFDNHHVAILFTGRELGHSNTDRTKPLFVVHKSSACRRHAWAAVKFSMSEECLISTVRAVGMMLGIDYHAEDNCTGIFHDVFNPNSARQMKLCSTQDHAKFIEKKPLSTKKKRECSRRHHQMFDIKSTYLSNCSAQDLTRYIYQLDKDNKNCLGKERYQPPVHLDTDMEYNGYMEPDIQCQEMFQRKTNHFMHETLERGNKMCGRGICFDPMSHTYFSFVNPRGVVCGYDSRCRQRTCRKADGYWPIKDPKCIARDSPNSFYNLTITSDTTCESFLSLTDVTMCDDEGFNFQCCKACEKLKNKIKAETSS